MTRRGIPPYGADFVMGHCDYDPRYNNTVYRWRGNEDYYLRSDRTSKKWWFFRHPRPYQIIKISELPYPSLTKAMEGFLKAVEALQLQDERNKKDTQ